MERKLRVALLFGGRSAEHDVSRGRPPTCSALWILPATRWY